MFLSLLAKAICIVYMLFPFMPLTQLIRKDELVEKNRLVEVRPKAKRIVKGYPTFYFIFYFLLFFPKSILIDNTVLITIYISIVGLLCSVNFYLQTKWAFKYDFIIAHTGIIKGPEIISCYTGWKTKPIVRIQLAVLPPVLLSGGLTIPIIFNDKTSILPLIIMVLATIALLVIPALAAFSKDETMLKTEFFNRYPELVWLKTGYPISYAGCIIASAVLILLYQLLTSLAITPFIGFIFSLNGLFFGIMAKITETCPYPFHPKRLLIGEKAYFIARVLITFSILTGLYNLALIYTLQS